ncbi:MAG: DUF1848 domain-containing protein [Kiritimatiellae bacterium]|nr:DUF1848 domain-containing protein [Kiritimatiellia bacterium]
MATWTKDEIVLMDGTKVFAQMPVIVSASRSTDIPAFYADWFMERLKSGYVKWFNPFNGLPLYVGFHKMRLIVFWSKNPAPTLSHLDELDKLIPNYYFQFTLNDYDAERIEPNVPPVSERIETFRQLSERLGRDRVVWRFDPLILTDGLTVRNLLEKVKRLGDQIAPLTSRLVFSFIDIAAYKKVAANMERSGVRAREFTPDEMEEMAAGIGALVKGWGIATGTCGELKDLDRYGIEHNRCVDDRLIMKCFRHDRALMEFIGARYVEPDMFSNPSGGWVLDEYRKDKGQRKACGCIMSKDIGEYNTCPHLCHYCYANTSATTAMANWKQHCDNPHAETITGKMRI